VWVSGKCGMPRSVQVLLDKAEKTGVPATAGEIMTIRGGLRLEETGGSVAISHVTACGNCRKIQELNKIKFVGQHPNPIAPSTGPNIATPLGPTDMASLLPKG
jgi:heterodisulfide reductase subunit A-like polyferredoxin